MHYDDDEIDFYDPNKVEDCPTSTLTARARYFYSEMDTNQQRFAQLTTEAALTRKQALKLMGIKELPMCPNRVQYVKIKEELLIRTPAVSQIDLLKLYAELHDAAKARHQYGNAKACLDSMAKLSGADQPRLDAQLPTDVGAEQLALDIVHKIANGEIPLREGQQLLQSLETGAKLSLAQRAIDAAPGSRTDDPLKVHAVGTQAHADAVRFASAMRTLRQLDSPLKLVQTNDEE